MKTRRMAVKTAVTVMVAALALFGCVKENPGANKAAAGATRSQYVRRDGLMTVDGGAVRALIEKTHHRDYTEPIRVYADGPTELTVENAFGGSTGGETVRVMVPSVYTVAGTETLAPGRRMKLLVTPDKGLVLTAEDPAASPWGVATVRIASEAAGSVTYVALKAGDKVTIPMATSVPLKGLF